MIERARVNIQLMFCNRNVWGISLRLMEDSRRPRGQQVDSRQQIHNNSLGTLIF